MLRVERLDSPIEADKVRVVCISDTHERLQQVMRRIPDGDILVHCGDFTCSGSEEAIDEFDRLMGELPHAVKLVVAGNHELGFDASEDEACRLPKVGGLRVYGASWHPLPGFPFYRSRGRDLLREWLKVPQGLDVLLTHTPPLGHRDLFDDGTQPAAHWGCAELLQVVERISKPKLHVFGHVHEQNGLTTNDQTIFCNASICDHRLNPRFDPHIFDFPLKPGATKDLTIKFV